MLLFDHRADHVETIPDATIRGAAHARDGVELVGIDEHVFVYDSVAHVEQNHFADHDGAAPRLVADFDDMVNLAFHIDRRFEHARGLDDVTRHGRESGHIEFVDVGRIVARGEVHLLRDLLADDVGHEFPGGLHVEQRVLGRSAVHGAEHDHGRLATNGVEETEGRQIDHAGGGNRRDEADGARNDSSGEDLIGDGRRNGFGIDNHFPDYRALSREFLFSAPVSFVLNDFFLSIALYT